MQCITAMRDEIVIAQFWALFPFTLTRSISCQEVEAVLQILLAPADLCNICTYAVCQRSMCVLAVLIVCDPRTMQHMHFHFCTSGSLCYFVAYALCLCRWAMQSMYFFVCSVPVLDLPIAHNTYSSVVFMFTFIFLQTLQPVLQLAFQWFNKQCCGWISFVIQIIPVHTGFCKCMVATGHTHTSKYAHVCEESHFVPRCAQGWQR